MIIDVEILKLATLAGLLGNVFPSLRAVCVESKENLIFVCFYCDGEISEDDRECCESTLDEVIGGCSRSQDIEFETPIVQLDYPHRMPLIGEWVFYRHENSAEYID